MTTLTNPKERIRIGIAAAHAIFRDGLRRLLEGEEDFEVAGEASDRTSAQKLVQGLKLDVLLLDLAMPQLSKPHGLRGMQTGLAEVRTILLVSTIHKDDLIEALQLGARGVLLKDSPAAVLFKSIRVVQAGQYWLGRESVSDVIYALRSKRPRGANNGGNNHRAFGLTHREQQVIHAIMDGYTNKDMAQEFRLSEHTVKHHLTNIFTKLGVSSRLELASFAAVHRLADGALPPSTGGGGSSEAAPDLVSLDLAHGNGKAQAASYGNRGVRQREPLRGQSNFAGTGTRR